MLHFLEFVSVPSGIEKRSAKSLFRDRNPRNADRRKRHGLTHSHGILLADTLSRFFQTDYRQVPSSFQKRQIQHHGFRGGDPMWSIGATISLSIRVRIQRIMDR
jgi:hypothetical protein